MSTDLPANVTFEPNADGFVLDQNVDAIRSVQAFLGRNGSFIVELWGTTTVVTPSGHRQEGREFQQNTDIIFDHNGRFTWQAERYVFDDSHEVSQATTFKLSGTQENVSRYRRI